MAMALAARPPSGYGAPSPASAQAPAPSATQIVDPPPPPSGPPPPGPAPKTPDGTEIEFPDDPAFPFCDEVVPGYQNNGASQPALRGQPVGPGEQPIYNSNTGATNAGSSVAQQSSPAVRGTSALPRNAHAAVIAVTLGACALLLY